MYLFVSIIFATLGSFANMLIFRLPREVPIGISRSRCITGHHTLGILDLIPIASYLALLGRCRTCAAKIPLRYLMVELGSVGIGLSLFYLYSFSWLFLFWAFVSYCGLIIFVTDMETQLIPDILPFLLFLGGISWNVFHQGWQVGLAGPAICGGVLLTLALVTQLIYNRPTLGNGDIKLMVGIGAIFGGFGGLWTLYFGFLLAGIVTVPLLLLKIRSRSDLIAFGPFIILGAVLTWMLCQFFVFPINMGDPTPFLIQSGLISV